MNYAIYDIAHPVHYLQIGHFIASPGWQHAPFQHKKDTEVMFGLKGDVALQIDHQETYHLHQGEVLTVFPHGFITGAAPVTESAEFYWFHFVQYGTYEITDTPPHLADESTQIVLPRHMVLKYPEQSIIMANQLLDVGHGHNYSNLPQDYLATLLLATLTNDWWLQNEHVTYEEGQSNQIKEWIRVNMNEDMAVSAIAEHFNMSQDYLSRLFKHATGGTIKGYLNKVRLDTARFLLLTTDLSIQEVAEHSYFNDYKYFFRLFRQTVHLTPAKYRNAFSRTFLNNPTIDPGFDIAEAVRRIESVQKKDNRRNGQLS
ncbi:AraC family transcriptional regulator [Schleiferilactobacillus shenzhenensis]|nr:helix-turn-helix domain-containing protein [Schleiferilactobacillus shenzhenensis]